MCITHQNIPLLDIIDRMDTSIKVPHDDKNLNPEQQVFCEELFNCLLHFLSVRATSGALCKMLCPELAGIFQPISNIFLPSSRKIIDIAEVDIVIQITDIPL